MSYSIVFCLDCVMQYAFAKKKAGDVVKYTPEEVMQFVQERYQKKNTMTELNERE